MVIANRVGITRAIAAANKSQISKSFSKPMKAGEVTPVYALLRRLHCKTARESHVDGRTDVQENVPLEERSPEESLGR